ncbi:MAG: hypothetical protein SGPRY_010630, partial [Prymnesium sp.]
LTLALALNLQARNAVLRRQLGALVHEKGQLNLQLQRRERELSCLAEEKASIVAALTSALRRVTAEREEAQMGKGRRNEWVGTQSEHAGQMVASQKRTIEALRREELDATREQMAMTSLQYRSDRASMATELAVLRSQVPPGKHPPGEHSLCSQLESVMSSEGWSEKSAVQLSDSEQQREALYASLQTQRESTNELQRQEC